MPNVKRADLEALRDMVSQANLIISGEPMMAGGVDRLRELLDTAERLADFLLKDSHSTPSPSIPKASRRS
jgi:hypothetical protein